MERRHFQHQALTTIQFGDNKEGNSQVQRRVTTGFISDTIKTVNLSNKITNKKSVCSLPLNIPSSRIKIRYKVKRITKQK